MRRGRFLRFVLSYDFLIFLGLLCTPLMINPSGFSYYHWFIKSNFITIDKLMSLDMLALLAVALGLLMLWLASRLTIKSWEVISSTFDKFWAFVIVAIVTALQVALLKESLSDNPAYWAYIIFIDVVVFDLYAIITKTADLRNFKLRSTYEVGDAHDISDEPENADEYGRS